MVQEDKTAEAAKDAATFFCLGCQETKATDVQIADQCSKCRQWACKQFISAWGKIVGKVRTCQVGQKDRQSPCFTCRAVKRRLL